MKENPETQTNTLEIDLLRFYDNFTELHDYTSFMYEALAGLLREENRFNTCTAMGADRLCSWMLHRMQALKEELAAIRDVSRDYISISAEAGNPIGLGEDEPLD